VAIFGEGGRLRKNTGKTVAVPKLKGMRIFVYEYTCGGPAKDVTHGSLRSEGWAMLSALLADFERVPGVETVTVLPVGVAHTGKTKIENVYDDEKTSFCRLAHQANYTLVIAPEFRDILATRCRWVLRAGGRLLGPDLSAILLTSDKLNLARHLLREGIQTPATTTYGGSGSVPFAHFPVVCKPRYGAGSQATFLAKNGPELQTYERQAAAEEWFGPCIIQPFVPGRPVSVAFLTGGPEAIALMPTEQILSEDGRFHYLGGRMPLAHPLAERALRLARQALHTIAGLRGYVGVDLVLGDAADGSEDYVIEINPRLTTSYVGFRALAESNLAEAMLQAGQGLEVKDLRWRSGSVEFNADGTVDLF
jgi:tyramine---L-glutamate ligase